MNKYLKLTLKFLLLAVVLFVNGYFISLLARGLFFDNTAAIMTGVCYGLTLVILDAVVVRLHIKIYKKIIAKRQEKKVNTSNIQLGEPRIAAI